MDHLAEARLKRNIPVEYHKWVPIIIGWYVSKLHVMCLMRYTLYLTIIGYAVIVLTGWRRV